MSTAAWTIIPILRCVLHLFVTLSFACGTSQGAFFISDGAKAVANSKSGSHCVSGTAGLIPTTPMKYAKNESFLRISSEDNERSMAVAARAGTGRREALRATVASTLSLATLFPSTTSTKLVEFAHAVEGEKKAAKSAKVLVLGGTGFVGSRVVQRLKDMGVDVTATSRDGRDGTVALDITSDTIADQVKKLSQQGYSAVISCVGSIGTDRDEAVNAGTGLAAMGAKSAGVDRFVYITVAPEVKEFAKGIDFLKGYMDGKTFSRDAVLKSFGTDKATLIEPTFIYGGGSFELNPPRVASFYGKFIEGILSSSPIRSVDRIMSPGFIKIALEPPVSVEAVADAAVAGALGLTSLPALDTYDKIKEASKLLEEV